MRRGNRRNRRNGSAGSDLLLLYLSLSPLRSRLIKTRTSVRSRSEVRMVCDQCDVDLLAFELLVYGALSYWCMGP